MGVEKFHDIREVPPVRSGGNPADNLRAAFALSALALRLAPRPPIRGVRKYRSVEKAGR